jgi:DNA mismatch endonuclease (patch repair protein)
VNTEPEIILRKELWKLGFRYRLHYSKLPGKPDIVFRKHNLVIFVDGEFWHGQNWKKKKPTIKSNRDYWIKKIEGNIKRDKMYNRQLKILGFTVLRFWEKQVKKNLPFCLSTIQSHL